MLNKPHSLFARLYFFFSTSIFVFLILSYSRLFHSRTTTDPEDPLRVTEQTRGLGLIVCRGTSVMTVAPSDGTEEIENPFAAAQG